MPVVLIRFMNVRRTLTSSCSAQSALSLFCCRPHNSYLVVSLVWYIALCKCSPTLSQGLAGAFLNNLTFGGSVLWSSLFSDALPQILQALNLPQTLISASRYLPPDSCLQIAASVQLQRSVWTQSFALQSGNCPQVEVHSQERYLVSFHISSFAGWHN